MSYSVVSKTESILNMINKKLFLLLIIANIGLVKAQYTTIPDPCFEVFLIGEGIDSEGTHDGQVLTSDINTITTLEVLPDGCQVTDLTGIQDFEYLEILNVTFMNLSELDVSQNLKLKELRCSDNNLTT